jgi:hypothetical protein
MWITLQGKSINFKLVYDFYKVDNVLYLNRLNNKDLVLYYSSNEELDKVVTQLKQVVDAKEVI